MKFSNTISDISLIHSGVEGKEEYSTYAYMLREKCGFVAVFDGCETMGNKVYEQADNRSEAYIASRVAADATLKWFKSDGFTFSRPDAENIAKAYYNALRQAKLSIDKNLPAPVGYSRTFPTSAMVVGFDCASTEYAKVEFLYTGNTRGFLLDQSGLCQISKDDPLDKSDCFGAAVADREIVNILSADGEEQISYRAIKLNYPCLLIASTAGAFAELQSPMHLEHIFLQAIAEAETLADLEEKLRFGLNRKAEDDYTVMTALVGFDSFEDAKTYYAKRQSALEETFITPFDAGDTSTWDTYKKTYYR